MSVLSDMSDESPVNLIQSVTLAIDAMGGDFGPESTVPGLAIVQKQFPQAHFLIFGDEARINPLLEQHKALAAVSTVRHTPKMVQNSEKPSAALRSSRDTSMRLAIEAVKTDEAQAVISSGNTGALMAMSKMILKPIAGIHRPAIASVFPTLEGGSTVMLDLGANVLVDAENLVQFAVLGAVFAKTHKGVAKPTVGLLNVGSEAMKGPDHVRGAADVLSSIQFPGRYFGFVEGNDVTKGIVDVVVADGYVGNIALKAMEGVGKFAGQSFKDAMTANTMAKIGALFAYGPLKKLKTKLDPRMYNGGVFLGLNGLCVKSHGGSDALGFSSAVKLAIDLAQHNYVQTVVDDINDLMNQESFLSQGTYHV